MHSMVHIKLQPGHPHETQKITHSLDQWMVSVEFGTGGSERIGSRNHNLQIVGRLGHWGGLEAGSQGVSRESEVVCFIGGFQHLKNSIEMRARARMKKDV